MYFKQFIYKCLCCFKLFLRGEFRGIRGPNYGSNGPLSACDQVHSLPFSAARNPIVLLFAGGGSARKHGMLRPVHCRPRWRCEVQLRAEKIA